MNNTNNDLWPAPKFYFEVQFGDAGTAAFQEVSGLDVEAQIIEYRAGDLKAFHTVKMPGIQKSSNITLKKGVFAKDNAFWDWFNELKMNTIQRKSVTIRLLDEGGSAVMTWTLANAYPLKLEGTDLQGNDHEVAIETMELAHEGLTMENG